MKIRDDLLTKMKETILSRELLFSPNATRNSQFLRRKQTKEEEPYIRPPFFRDADRIIQTQRHIQDISTKHRFFFLSIMIILHIVSFMCNLFQKYQEQLEGLSN